MRQLLVRLRAVNGVFSAAAAMSFYSVLNLIPLLYIGFFIFTKTPSFAQYAARAKSMLLQMLLPTADASSFVAIESFMQKAAHLDAFGFLALFFAIFSAFISYERTICNITKSPPRSLLQAIALYWALTTLAPLGLGLSFYISFNIQSQLGINLAALLPFFIIWALFLSSYYCSINLSLNLKSALVISFLAALIWSIFKMIFLWYLSRNNQLASIYGGFSVVFIFFMWLYFSWIIYLYSCAICARFCGEYPPNKSEKQIVRTKRKSPRAN